MIDNAKGMLTGLAVGDALGMVCEFEQPGTFPYVDEMRAGGPFNLPKGYWTDDTSMALCLAESLLNNGGYDSYDVMGNFTRWRNEGYLSSTGLCFDCGGQIQAAIRDFESDKSAWVAKDTPRTEAAGNGAIMRLAPVVLAAFKHRSEKDILAMVRLSARETHYSFEAEAGAEVFAALLIQAMKANGNKTKVADIDSLSTGNLFDDIWRRVRQPQELNTSGYIVHSLQVAWWAFQTYDSFRDGMLAVVNLGGDSDTNGAIYGQLAGAFYGYEAIPTTWRHDLYDEANITKKAELLYAMDSCEILVSRFEIDKLPLLVNKPHKLRV